MKPAFPNYATSQTKLLLNSIIWKLISAFENRDESSKIIESTFKSWTSFLKLKETYVKPKLLFAKKSLYQYSYYITQMKIMVTITDSNFVREQVIRISCNIRFKNEFLLGEDRNSLSIFIATYICKKKFHGAESKKKSEKFRKQCKKYFDIVKKYGNK